MDVGNKNGNKSLAQLAAEHNETKYIQLDIASKLSGYTVDYLTRLCRLGKIEYRLWNNDQIVPELESLLKETHTILVSYEGVNLVNKDETHEDPNKIKDLSGNPANKTEEKLPPEFPNANIAHTEKEVFMYVGRPVVGGEESSLPLTSVAHRASVPTQETAYPHQLNTPAVETQVQAIDTSEKTVVAQVSPVVEHFVTTPIQAPKEEPKQDVPDVKPEVVAATIPTYVTEQRQPIEQTFEDEKMASVVRMQDTRKQVTISEQTVGSSNPNALLIPSPSMPMIEEEHHMIKYDQSPLSSSRAFQVALVLALIGLSGLVGWLATTPRVGEPKFTSTEQVDTQVAGVINAFSDEIVVERGRDKDTITVRPIFPNGVGKASEFMLVPVGK